MSLWSQVEKRFVFFPAAEVEYTPGDLGLEYQDVFFPTQDGLTLHGWFIPAPAKPGNPSGQTWIWFHGNGGNIGHRVDEIALLHHRLQVDLFIFDYRGYGRSPGTPSEKGTYLDARAALRRLLERPGVNPDAIVYYGHSLGTAVAAELALSHPPLGMAFISPFTSIRDMAKLAVPLPGAGWLVRNHYDTSSRIRRVHAPLMILHGDLDEVVPISHARRLFESANQPKTLTVLKGAGHNSIYDATPEGFFGALERFQTEISQGGAGR